MERSNPCKRKKPSSSRYSMKLDFGSYIIGGSSGKMKKKKIQVAPQPDFRSKSVRRREDVPAMNGADDVKELGEILDGISIIDNYRIKTQRERNITYKEFRGDWDRLFEDQLGAFLEKLNVQDDSTMCHDCGKEISGSQSHSSPFHLTSASKVFTLPPDEVIAWNPVDSPQGRSHGGGKVAFATHEIFNGEKFFSFR